MLLACRLAFGWSGAALVIGVLALLTTQAEAQSPSSGLPQPQMTIPTKPPDFQEMMDLLHNRVKQPITLRDSGVSWLDSAVPATQIRFRFDAGYGVPRPDRGEYFWPQTPGRGPGSAETNVDFQDFLLGFEYAPADRWSLFGELPFRLVDPERNHNTGGLADGNVGGKFALLQQPDLIASAFLRTTFPSGSGRKGLGSRHVSLEPGVLMLKRLGKALAWEAEVSDIIPLGGSNGFAGNIVRYGTGVTYALADTGVVHVQSVAEIVGWTFTGGDMTIVDGPTTFHTESAAGDTILNTTVSLRINVTQYSLLFGYAHGLTDAPMYNHLLRVELRRSF